MVASVYVGMHMSELTNLLKVVLLVKLLCLYLQHDGAPPQFNCAVKPYLHYRFYGRWIDRGGRQLCFTRISRPKPLKTCFLGGE
jgi:hypothetical protein